MLGKETLRNLVDAGRDGRNRLDGRFHLPDVLVVAELFGEEAGNAFETLNRHRETLSFFSQPAPAEGISLTSPQNGNQVRADHLEQLAGLADNDQFARFLEDEGFSLADWAASENSRGSEVVQSLFDAQANAGPPLNPGRIDDIVTSAAYITDNELLSFQYFNSADGNRGSSFLSFDDLNNLAALSGG